MFLGKGVLKKCSKFTGEQPCRIAISINLQSMLLHIFKAPFPKNTSGRLLLNILGSAIWRRILDLLFPP